jgi:hypothetical protein
MVYVHYLILSSMAVLSLVLAAGGKGRIDPDGSHGQAIHALLCRCTESIYRDTSFPWK